ncbi:hypothetical protein KEM48_008752 [Puccinia striiformis f. sp. tritici PST-130]|nr:hypothetical protein KEM48_008752 [Puccinia striiformis f. sp. tritici PST-130]
MSGKFHLPNPKESQLAILEIRGLIHDGEIGGNSRRATRQFDSNIKKPVSSADFDPELPNSKKKLAPPRLANLIKKLKNPRMNVQSA